MLRLQESLSPLLSPGVLLGGAPLAYWILGHLMEGAAGAGNALASQKEFMLAVACI